MSDKLPESSTPLAEINHGPSAFELFLDRNQKLLVILSIVTVLAVLAWIIRGSIVKNKEETAGAALVKASDLAGYLKVVSEQKGTPAAGSAAVLAANAQWESGQQADAIATLRNFISASPKHPAVPAASANLAAKLMMQGKNEEATKEFQALASDPSSEYLAAFAIISQGDIALAAGDADKAEAHYKKALADFPENPFSRSASQRIASLRAKAPVEIDAPPQPVTPPAAPGLTPAPFTPGTVLPNGLKIEEVREEEVPEDENSTGQSPDQQ